MTRQISIDRETELALFDKILAGQVEARILLVEAPSGWGKSILLREFARCRPQGFDFADIDFKGGDISLAELFSRLCDKLGGWRCFPNLQSELRGGGAQHTINIEKNTLLGQNQIDVYLVAQNDQERQFKLAMLTDALFVDLRALEKTLLIFDTFEKANSDIRSWLAGSFLPRAACSKKLHVVIGGQYVPEQTLEWECEKIPLGGIHHEHWHKYALSMGITLDIRFIEGCCSFCKGHPLQMKSFIDSMVIQGRTL